MARHRAQTSSHTVSCRVWPGIRCKLNGDTEPDAVVEIVSVTKAVGFVALTVMEEGLKLHVLAPGSSEQAVGHLPP
jgi:hypothetical protein